MMRNQYNDQLQLLHGEMVHMGSLCEEAITTAIRSLVEDDLSLITHVFETDAEIDRKEREIESMCMKLLLRQQPVASDLRAISSALKMISDMERIGDQASDIAEIAKYVIPHDCHSEGHIKEMADEAIKMVTESVQSYVEKNLEQAVQVIRYDDVVDDWFARIKTELIAMLRTDSSRGEYYVDLLMIAKYLERIGDHATNIAEWVEYSLTGEHITH